MEIPKDDLQAYLEQYCDTEPELLSFVSRETHLKVSRPRMLSGHYQGRVLSLFSKLVAPRRILEIGTFTGYATLCLAEGLTSDGLIHTIDVNEELEERVRSFFDKSELRDKIVYHLGDAAGIIPSLNEVFDIVFIDADKKSNETYYDMVFDRVRPGGLIITDNVLWYGKITAGATDMRSQKIRGFLDKVVNDCRVEKLVLPVRDGLLITRKL